MNTIKKRNFRLFEWMKFPKAKDPKKFRDPALKWHNIENEYDTGIENYKETFSKILTIILLVLFILFIISH